MGASVLVDGFLVIGYGHLYSSRLIAVIAMLVFVSLNNHLELRNAITF